MQDKYGGLKEDTDISAWYNEQTSPLTAANYLRMAGKFFETIYGKVDAGTWKLFLGLSMEEQAKAFRSYAAKNRDNIGFRPSVGVVRKALLSWFRFNLK